MPEEQKTVTDWSTAPEGNIYQYDLTEDAWSEENNPPNSEVFTPKSWWVSCRVATGRVDTYPTEPYVITDSAPIWRKFIGRELSVLVNWLTKKFGQCEQEEL